MLLLKLDILRHRIMGTHHVQYSVLKTPEQTKQRPASLIYSKQHDLTKNGFLTQIKKDISLDQTGSNDSYECEIT